MFLPFIPKKSRAFGDGGGIITNNLDLYNKMKLIRNIGSQKISP